jgi:arylsulfatase A-like enzyme
MLAFFRLLSCVTCIYAAPSIFFILADDLGSNDVGYVNKQNAHDIRTPNIDRISGMGVRLSNYYTQHICAPTRSQFLSGRYQIHTGLQHANIDADQENGMPLNETMISNRLKSLGYETYGYGKWHAGFWTKKMIPAERGFDHWFGYLQGAQDYYTHNDACGGGKGLDLRQDTDSSWVHTGNYSTYMYTTRVVEDIHTHVKTHGTGKNATPMFVYLAYQAVHGPLEAPAEAIAKFPDILNKKRQIYAAMLYLLDEGVGNVTTALEESGLMASSVVCFSSDNGGQVKDGGNNWPWRGWKGSLWEGGVRNHAWVYSPLLGSSSYSFSGLVHVSDFHATFFALGGGDLDEHKGLDGFNFWPAISGNTSSPRTEILHNIDPIGLCPSKFPLPPGAVCDSKYGSRNAALRVGDWKLLLGYPGDWPSHQDGWVPPPNWGPPDPPTPPLPSACGACTFTKQESIDHPGGGMCLFNIRSVSE